MSLPAGVKLLPGGLVLHRLRKSDGLLLLGYLALLLFPVLTVWLRQLGYYEDLLPREKWGVYFLAVSGGVAALTL
jgi:hypothetical protein